MKNILLGVSASVAAIKAKQLVLALSEFANVRIVMTAHAEYFLKADLQVLTEHNIPIYKDQDEWPELSGHYPVGEPILHIELRRWADCLLVAPLDANTLAKIAHGFCDNLLTSVVRAWDYEKPIFFCPAMNTMMWLNPPTAEQIELLRSWGGQIIEPIEKKLACNDIGMGAMENVDEIVRVVKKDLG